MLCLVFANKGYNTDTYTAKKESKKRKQNWDAWKQLSTLKPAKHKILE